MIYQFDHQLSQSLYLFLENQLLSKGEAYTNTSGELYSSDQTPINGLNFSNSPAPQWVYDSSITGADIPSGVYLDGNFTPRGDNGVNLNFAGGGAYHSGSYTVTSNYAKKDFNFYLMPQEEVEMILEEAHTKKENKFPLELGESLNYKVNAPCILINSMDSKNDPFAFGGHDETNSNFQATIIADNTFLRDGAISIFRDLNEVCFPVVSEDDTPFNSYGDLKTGSFNYNDLYTKYPNPSQNCTVDRVISTNVRQRSDGRSNFFLGYAEFRLLNYRYPRV